jgi:integrase
MKEIKLTIRSKSTSTPITITVKSSMPNYSDPEIFVPMIDGNPTVAPRKQWYVFYYFRNPNTGYMERQRVYEDINRLKTVQERMAHGKVWVNAMKLLLDQGFNPFDEIGIAPKSFEVQVYTVKAAFEYAYDNKIAKSKDSTASDYKTRMNVFLEWCQKNKIDGIDIRELQDTHVIGFLNYLIAPLPNGRDLGGTSQDNYKRCLSALMTKLVRDRIIKENIITSIFTEKDEPIKNTPFTGYETRKIRDYLLVHDKKLYYFIQFVIYSFLRPVEVVRLKVGDFNEREKYFKVETKTDAKGKKKQKKTVKKIIDPIQKFLTDENILDYPKECSVFSLCSKPAVWEAKEKTKVDHYAYRFRAVKKHFGFDGDYGIYSFRHTAALDLFNAFMKDGATEHEAILKLMPITGHKSEDALRNYLRDVGGMLPKDWGQYYTLNF